MSTLTNDQTAALEALTVEYWRERYQKVRPRFGTLTEVWEVVSSDTDFAGVRGHQRLKNIQSGLGGLHFTAKAVLLMEQARPDSGPANPQHEQADALIKKHGLQKLT